MTTADTPIEVSVLIVSYNTAEVTAACIQGVIEATAGTDYEILVVDNASSDGSVRILRERFPELRIQMSDRNLGFGRACNLAAREARGRLLLLLNPDTRVQGDAISELVRFSRQYPEAGFWGGRTLNPDGSVALETCSRFPSLWSTFCRVAGISKVWPSSDLFDRETYGGWKRDGIREVEVLSGCWLLIGREIWDRLGGFDPIFFMYSEEVDLCLRARAAGARPMFTPAAEIVHYGGMSERTRSRRVCLLLKGKTTYMRLHWGPFRREIGIFLLMIWPLSRYLVLSLWGHIGGNAARHQAAREWREVWQARGDWRLGYRKEEAGPDGGFGPT